MEDMTNGQWTKLWMIADNQHEFPIFSQGKPMFFVDRVWSCEKTENMSTISDSSRV